MSKTDKTRPWQIQATDDLVEYHDHRNGVCNLPTRAEWIKNPQVRRFSRFDCVWQPRNWNTFKGFTRYAGEKSYRADKRKHKYPDWKNN